MAWKYFRITSGGSSSTEFNPKEFNILAGTTQCQVGGTITSDRAPMWSTLATVIDGSLTTATYWPAGTNPTCNLTMAAEHADITSIEIHHTFSHYHHSVWLSENNIDWIPCPFKEAIGATQYFSIPALPEPDPPPQGDGTPVNWINGVNVSISNGTVTKTGGGNAFNGGASGNVMYQADDALFFQVTAPKLIEACFGYTEEGLVAPTIANENITYKFDLYADGTYRIYCYNQGVKTGTYKAGDTFKVKLVGDGTVDFIINDIFVEGFAGTIYWPMYIDIGLYAVGDSLTASINGPLATGTNFDETATQNITLTQDEAQEYQLKGYSYEQTAQLNIGMSEDAAKEYTAKGYNHNRWTLNYLDYYFFGDQTYTPQGYTYEQTAIEPIGLTETASQNYTAKGYEYLGTDLQEIIFDFGAAQVYTPQGYNFEQNTQENIFVDFIGAQAYTPEGYDVATMAQENILLVQTASQVYTAKGYNFEATTAETIPTPTQEAAQVFAAHFEQEAQDNINLTMQASQAFAARFESQAQLNFALNDGASQSYTAKGYINETSTTETINLSIGAAQVFAAHFEQFGTELITIGEVTNTEYQANFRANAQNILSIVDSAAQTVVFSNGLQFQENAQDNINITYGAAQEFTPFGGYSFNQTGANEINLSMAASLLYELGETGKFSQRAALYLPLQESTQATYTNNWLEFGANAAESMALIFGATSEHTEAHIFEANAAEVLTFYISPLQFYGHYNEATTQESIGLSISATSVYTNVFNEYEGTTLESFYLHHTDKALHEVNYLSFHQNMYYDFLFWHYADSVHTVGSKEFSARANESTSLLITASVQYTNANYLNSFATEAINLSMAAHVDHIKATIYEFNQAASETIQLNLLAASEHIEATIYEFTARANESIALSFGAVSEHVEAHIYDHAIIENITLTFEALSEYQNINPFNARAIDYLMYEDWATFEVTTEPRNYVEAVELSIKLKIVNWVYFESDIYKPTYKLEVEKPNTLWEPTDEDRPSPYIFGRNPDNRIDRRILHLTDIEQPKKISYEKPNTLYTENKELERGLIDD